VYLDEQIQGGSPAAEEQGVPPQAVRQEDEELYSIITLHPDPLTNVPFEHVGVFKVDVLHWFVFTNVAPLGQL
jgi:hypothetical protein